ncbi:MAG TPA: L,D-transpeptidase [Rhizomicrobium sp.]|nr:L,D-transpeptidase [Rhizomicrobium sp.]
MRKAYSCRKMVHAVGFAACAAILALAADEAFAQSSAQPSAQSSWFASTPQSNGQSPSDPRFDEVALRIEANLSDEMIANFNLFIYVDKAETGPLAQRMYVFRKTDQGDLALLYDWSVSTGRERFERDVHGHVQSSFTPKGYFEIDPKRLYADHASAQWDEAMPYAMFFNWKPDGHQTGLAIHGTAEDGESALGTRASAGCVRLSLDNAHTLFDLVRSQLRGPTPKLAYLDRDSEVSSEGLFLHDAAGRLQSADGYPVLVLVDDYGGENRVTSLY